MMRPGQVSKKNDASGICVQREWCIRHSRTTRIIQAEHKLCIFWGFISEIVIYLYLYSELLLINLKISLIHLDIYVFEFVKTLYNLLISILVEFHISAIQLSKRNLIYLVKLLFQIELVKSHIETVISLIRFENYWYHK